MERLSVSRSLKYTVSMLHSIGTMWFVPFVEVVHISESFNRGFTVLVDLVMNACGAELN